MSFHLGRHRIDGKLFLAPMAGVTDAAFRRLCCEFGADYAVGEMLASAPQLRNNRKTLSRLRFFEAEKPRVVQLLGADPDALVDAFGWACDQGAQVIDFNMGCPAKKVCNVACGSALMRDEKLAREIFDKLGRVSAERAVPVTLKCRTGGDEAHKNAVDMARWAEQAGFSMLTLHGRTRAGGFESPVEYAMIAEAAAALTIPVVANGDIADTNRAKAVLNFTKAQAVMIGRAALGRPWIFKEIKEELRTGKPYEVSRGEKVRAILAHWQWHMQSYPEPVGVMTFRKHLLWYLAGWPDFESVRGALCQARDAAGQLSILKDYFNRHGWIV